MRSTRSRWSEAERVGEGRTEPVSDQRWSAAAMSKPGRSRKKSPFATIDDAIAAIGRGEMIIVVDDEDRENEGDLTIAADKITPDAINFMAKHGRGLICLALDAGICEQLALQPMSAVNTARFGTA